VELLVVTLLGSLIVPFIKEFANVVWARVRRQSLRVRISGLEIKLEAADPEKLNALLDLMDSEDRRLLEYTAARDEAERELASYLPDNPRRAKRLINHERLYARIAEDRNIFGGTPALTHRHLAKWVLIVERWPRLGAALTRNPSQMKVLEEAPDYETLKNGLSFAGIRSTDRLFEIIHEGVLLSPILERLVRFEASTAYGQHVSADMSTCQTTNENAERLTASQAETTA